MSLPPPGSHIHLIGIGGTGMSAIARVLLGQGYRVTGSDRSPGELASALVNAGAAVIIGHDPASVAGADAVIVTSAAAVDHVEVVAARNAGIPVYKRSEIIGDLTRGKKVIAVAGTAGKTTTTAMIAHLLTALRRDPSYIVGSTLPATGKNGHAGTGDFFVIEADEYDNMFLGLSPYIAIITNIVWDHPDFFPTETGMFDTFMRFAERITPDGWLIVCGEDYGAASLARRFSSLPPSERRQRKIRRYGIYDPDCDLLIENPHSVGGFPAFDLRWHDDHPHTFQLSVPGRHNILNAAAAIEAVRTAVGLPDDTSIDELQNAMTAFTGTGRRFEIMGERHGVIVVDDYAHHPLKIRAALEAARSLYPERTIWALWQPHTYSRTQALWDDFAASFGDADHVLVMPIYAAREDAIGGIDGAGIAEAVAKSGHPDARHVESFDAAVNALLRNVKPPAVIIILSAGDAPKIGRVYLGQ